MKHITWINIRLVLILSAVIFLYSFANKKNEDRKLKKIEIVFLENKVPLIETITVNKLLIENITNSKSIDKLKLDLNKLEKVLNAHKMIEKSDVFLSIDGKLKAVVKQKTAVARYFDGNNSFYLDYTGTRMPLSLNFTDRVPLVSGKFNKKNERELFKIFRMIFDDSFLKKNIIGIEIMPNGGLVMYNRNFNYQIIFGSTINKETKFRNYKAFFQKAVLDSTLYKYKKIDLRFSKQIVCTK